MRSIFKRSQNKIISTMKPKSTHGGSRPGVGRKTTRPVSKQPVYLYADQIDKYGTSEKVRKALDNFVYFAHVTEDDHRYVGNAIVTKKPGFEPDVLILTCEEQDENGVFVRVFYPYGKEADACEADKALRRLIEQTAIEAQ